MQILRELLLGKKELTLLAYKYFYPRYFGENSLKLSEPTMIPAIFIMANKSLFPPPRIAITLLRNPSVRIALQ